MADPMSNHYNSLILPLGEELPKDGLADWSIVYIGVGKVNAAINLIFPFTKTKPDQLINYGTAQVFIPGMAHFR